MREVIDSELAALRREVARLRDAIVEARSEAARQADMAFQREAQRIELLRRSAEASAAAAKGRTELLQRIGVLEAENKQVNADKAGLGGAVKGLQAQLATMSNEVEQLNARIRTFKNSVSWKVTLPIRKVAVVAKSLRRGKK